MRRLLALSIALPAAPDFVQQFGANFAGCYADGVMYLDVAGGAAIFGQPGLLHYGKCVAPDGTVYRARYNDQFH